MTDRIHYLHSPSNFSQSFKKLVMMRCLAANILVCLLQYSGLSLSTLTPSSPLWLASGTAYAFILMRGFRILPGIWIGSVFAFALAHAGWFISLASATLLTMQTALLFSLCYRYISPTLIFLRIRLLLKFLVCAAVVTGMTSVLLSRLCPINWLEGWLANFNGTVIIATAIITWDYYFPAIHDLKKRDQFKLSIPYGCWLILIMLLITSHTSLIILLSAIATLPLLLLIRIRDGWCGTITALCLFGFVLCLCGYLQITHFSLEISYFLRAWLTFETIIALCIATFQPFNRRFLYLFAN